MFAIYLLAKLFFPSNPSPQHLHGHAWARVADGEKRESPDARVLAEFEQGHTLPSCSALILSASVLFVVSSVPVPHIF